MRSTTRWMVAVALATSLLGVARAEGPARAEVSRYFSHEEGVPTADCGDFLVLLDWSATWTVVRHLDASGAVVSENWHASVTGRDRYYNSTDPSKEVLGGPGEVQNSRYDPVASTLTFTGGLYRVTLPGRGVILLEAGTQIIDLGTGAVIAHHGPYDVSSGDVALLCDALR